MKIILINDCGCLISEEEYDLDDNHLQNPNEALKEFLEDNIIS